MHAPRIARLIAAALAVLVATPVLAGPRMEVAVEDDAVFVQHPQDDPLRALAFQRAHELGATHIRANAWWRRKLDGTIDEDFSKLDSFVDEARARGFVVQLTCGGIAADWGSPDAHAVAPTGVTPLLSEYLDFLGKVVAHFKGRVERFSIWNEPNHPGFLLAGPVAAVASYQQLERAAAAATDPAVHHKLAHRAAQIYRKEIVPENVKWVRELWHQGVKTVRKIDPHAQVLVGELSSGNFFPFLEAVLRHGKKLVADGIAVHPYQYTVRPESTRGTSDANGGIAEAKRIQKTLARLAARERLVNRKGDAVPLYFTEFGYHKLEGRTLLQPDRQIPEGRRAAWTPRAFEVARKAHARQMLYYQLFAEGPSYPWDTSILDADGTPDESFHALQDWVAKHPSR